MCGEIYKNSDGVRRLGCNFMCVGTFGYLRWFGVRVWLYTTLVS